MALLDFLIYYMTYWIQNTNYKLVWNTPVSRACYVIGLALTTLLWTIGQILFYTIFKGINDQTPGIILILLGLAIIAFLQYLYITKDRYNYISPFKFTAVKKLSDKTRSIIVIVFVVISVLSSLFISTISLVKYRELKIFESIKLAHKFIPDKSMMLLSIMRIAIYFP